MAPRLEAVDIEVEGYRKHDVEAVPTGITPGEWVHLSVEQRREEIFKKQMQVEELRLQIYALQQSIVEEMEGPANIGKLPPPRGDPEAAMAAGYGFPFLPDWGTEAVFAQNMYGGNPMGFVGTPWLDTPPVPIDGLGCCDLTAMAGYQDEHCGGMKGDEYEDDHNGANLEEGTKKSKRRGPTKGRKGGVATGPAEGTVKRPDGSYVTWVSVEKGDEEDRWLDQVVTAIGKGAEQTHEDRHLVEKFIEELRGKESKMIQRSFGSSKGSRLVQEILKTRGDVQAEIAWEMSACVEQAWAHEHANFVISAIVQFCGFRECKFIAEGVRDKAVQCARQRFGCRIVIKLIEFCKRQMLETEQIIEELLSQVGDLIKHAFGHHVIMTILEHGDTEHKQAIVEQLMTDLSTYATHRHASHVVEKALDYAVDMDKYRVQIELTPQVKDLAKHPFAYYCVHHIVDTEELSDLIEEMKEEETDGGAGRRAVLEKSGVQRLPGCEDVTHDTPPRDIVLRILTSEKCVRELLDTENQDCKAQKFGSRMVEELRKGSHLTHLNRFTSLHDETEERCHKRREEVNPGDDVDEEQRGIAGALGCGTRGRPV